MPNAEQHQALPEELSRAISEFNHRLQMAVIQRDAAWLESPGSMFFEDFNLEMHRIQRTTIDLDFFNLMSAIVEYNRTRPNEQPITHQNNELIAFMKILYTLYHRRQTEWLHRRNYYTMFDYIAPFEEEDVPALVECLESYNRFVPNGARVFPRDVVALQQSNAVYQQNERYNNGLIEIDLMRNHDEATEQERIQAGLSPHAIYPTMQDRRRAYALYLQGARARAAANQPAGFSAAQRHLEADLYERMIALAQGRNVNAPETRYPGPPAPRRDAQVSANGSIELLPRECCICIEDIDSNAENFEGYHVTPCNHEYHIACLRRWLQHGAFNCPKCRTDLNQP